MQGLARRGALIDDPVHRLVIPAVFGKGHNRPVPVTGAGRGLYPGQKIAGLLVFLSDVHALGLDTAQGLQMTVSFYWDMDDETRAWSQRFFEKTGKMPTGVQAGTYSSVRHYLKAIEATGSDDTETVLAKMREMPVEDMFARGGVLRTDGRMVHDMYLAEVKSPAESSGPWDYLKIVRTIPGEEAYGPLSESTCPTK